MYAGCIGSTVSSCSLLQLTVTSLWNCSRATCPSWTMRPSPSLAGCGTELSKALWFVKEGHWWIHLQCQYMTYARQYACRVVANALSERMLPMGVLHLHMALLFEITSYFELYVLHMKFPSTIGQHCSQARSSFVKLKELGNRPAITRTETFASQELPHFKGPIWMLCDPSVWWHHHCWLATADGSRHYEEISISPFLLSEPCRIWAERWHFTEATFISVFLTKVSIYLSIHASIYPIIRKLHSLNSFDIWQKKVVDV